MRTYWSLMKGICLLCQEEHDLQLSHIIPKFVLNWLKQTSPGFIREGTNPNRRVQDGPKDYLLCHSCEQRLGRWEKAFAEKIFFPLHEGEIREFKYPYNEWALKFAVSVSWRALAYSKKKIGLSHFSELQLNYVERALKLWGEFLLDRQSNPGMFEQHILPLEIIENHNVPNLSPFMNRYILRTVDIDVIRSENSACVYTKMCKLVLFGFIQPPSPRIWKGTKLHVKHGAIGSTHYVVPENILEYFNHRASMAGKALAKISQKQADKINNIILDQIDEVSYSEVFRAMSRDVAFSGKKAFEITHNDDKEN